MLTRGARPWPRWRAPTERGRRRRWKPSAPRSAPGWMRPSAPPARPSAPPARPSAAREAERVPRLQQELVEVRANRAEVGPDSTDAAYSSAFRAADLDLDVLEPAELARRLRRQPEAVVVELSAFLDDWSFARAARRGAPSPPGASRWKRRGWRTRSRIATACARSSWPRTASRRSRRSSPWRPTPRRPDCPRRRPSCWAGP